MNRWQRSVTLKAIRENRVRGFDCGYCAKAEDMNGTMLPEFAPFWDAQWLGDGTFCTFDTIKECQAWIRGWE
tara:strand:+ start:186 stop:401 length:216 start_codon:yes stop_codon:yes gene_type:complete